MLIPKKINKKKLILYFIIMAIMVGGTAFLIYQNYLITSKKSPVMDIPAETSDATSTRSNVPSASGYPTEQVRTISDSEKTGDSTGKVSEILDISILNDNKFQALKKNIISQSADIEVGRKNPFEPY